MSHHKYRSITLPILDNSLQSFSSRDLPCLFNSSIYNTTLVVPLDEHVLQFSKSLLPIFWKGADPHYSEGQGVWDVVGDMGWVAGGGEEVLAAVSGFPVEVCYDFAIFDCAEGVQEGDAF